MRIATLALASLLLLVLGCRGHIQPPVPHSDHPLHGCWRLSRPVFRGLPLASPYRDPPWDTVELLTATIGQYGAIRVLAVPGRRASDPERVPYRLHGWQPIAPDSVEIFWSKPPNAMEVRLQVMGDSARGEFFYHGDILAPGQSADDLRRPPIPVSAVRVQCPTVQAG